MKAFLLLAAVLAPVLSIPVEDLYFQEGERDIPEAFQTAQDNNSANSEIRNSRLQSIDIVYHFFNAYHRERSIKVRINDIGGLSSGGTGFSSSRDTLFVIHGWNGHNESSSNENIRAAILEKHNINVFVVDWRATAEGGYISAQGSVLQVGRYVAEFIRVLEARLNLRIPTVSFVGFSLGAHVSGNAGAALGGQVHHIVGLDPAGPLFTERNTENRLDPSDAQFVQIIHTNGGLLGYRGPCGHSDFYPNGGSSQPGCGLDLVGSCAHSRAYAYYSEAVRDQGNRFVGRRCGSQRDYDRGRCANNPSSFMGGFYVDTRARGDFYLNTNSVAPFARG